MFDFWGFYKQLSPLGEERLHALVVGDTRLIGPKRFVVGVFDDFCKPAGPVQAPKQPHVYAGKAPIKRNGLSQIRGQVVAGWLSAMEPKMQNHERTTVMIASLLEFVLQT